MVKAAPALQKKMVQFISDGDLQACSFGLACADTLMKMCPAQINAGSV
jgi:hypothetical protein